jgi:hypothetical protein
MSRADRREFPRAVKVAVIRRATKDGVTYCEKCGAIASKWQIDHVRADGLLGEPTLENAQLLGECCYGAKNADDAAQIALAKRREAYHLGIEPPNKRKLRGRARKARAPYRPSAGQPRLLREGFIPAGDQE